MSASMENAAMPATSPKGLPTLQEVGVIREPCKVCILVSYSHLYFLSMSIVDIINLSR
jgi:hypothetical protein